MLLCKRLLLLLILLLLERLRDRGPRELRQLVAQVLVGLLCQLLLLFKAFQSSCFIIINLYKSLQRYHRSSHSPEWRFAVL